MNAPRHPLEEQLAERLLPAVAEHSAVDRRKHALGVARMVLEALEKNHRAELEGRR